MGVGEYLSRGGYPSMEGIVTAKRPLVSYVSNSASSGCSAETLPANSRW